MRLSTCFVLIAFFAGGCFSHAQPTSAPVAPALPSPDSFIEARLRMATDLKATESDRCTALVEILQARIDGRIRDEVCLPQFLAFVVRAIPTAQSETQGMYIYAVMQLSIFGAAPHDVLTILGPYTESSDQQVSKLALDMIEYSQALSPSGSASAGSIEREFYYATTYIGTPRPAPKVILRMYEIDADAALYTIASRLGVAEQGGLERLHKQMAFRILAYELLPANDQPETQKRARATLVALSEHPHWCARLYALAVMRAQEWTFDREMVSRLAKDENSMVSTFAEEILKQKEASK